MGLLWIAANGQDDKFIVFDSNDHRSFIPTKSMIKLLSVLLLLCVACAVKAQPSSNAPALDRAKKKCADLGFKAGTERFGSCVLQLSRNDEPPSNLAKPTQPDLKPVAVPEALIILKSFKDCEECPEMVTLPAGTYLMGSKDDPFKSRVEKSEIPQHSVNVQSFAIGKTEVTQEQWYAVMGTLPSNFKGRTLPVEQVSWNDAKEFVKKLSEKTGKNYRLPTEAEWEYACRAGASEEYCGSNNAQSVGWSNVSSVNETQNVASKQANAWDLYDMSGNVWEWTEDCWNENYSGAPVNGSAWLSGDCTRRVARGGPFNSVEFHLRSSSRTRDAALSRSGNSGFRVARTP
jgi:formylglycine-generating enzyme required for sulfatase activity